MPLRPSGKKIWEKHVKDYTEIFRRALIALSSLPKIDASEVAISTQLNTLLQKECFKYNRELPYPKYNLPIPPKAKGKNSVQEKTGQPDFTCCFKDGYAEAYDKSEFNFHIECKCLGLPNRSNWVFNKNYVNEGIMRFDHKDKCYGENAADGMMVGYIISMNTENICKEVNAELAKIKRNFSPICFVPSSELLKETTQQLKRVVIAPSDFTLTHLWIVLTHCLPVQMAVENDKQIGQHVTR